MHPSFTPLPSARYLLIAYAPHVGLQDRSIRPGHSAPCCACLIAGVRQVLEPNQAASPPLHCIVVIDQALDPGRAANAAAVLALSVGGRHPQLPGRELVDAAGQRYPGLIASGVPVLGASADHLPELRERALAQGCDVVAFPVEGQATTNYDALCETVATIDSVAMRYLGIALVGAKPAVRKLVSKLSLLS